MRYNRLMEQDGLTSQPDSATIESPVHRFTANTLFAGAGEMRALARQFQWHHTALGPVESWPSALCIAVRTVMASRHPMFLWWGPELVQIFNDAYRPSFGLDGRHLRALGARGREFWTEIWEVISPQIEQVMSGGPSTWHENQYLPIERNGRLEDVYWTYSYSPAFGDHDDVAGVLVVCQETTRQVQLQALLEVERSRLSYVFQQAPSFFAVLRGPTFVFDFVNDAYQTLVGKTDLKGRGVFEAIPEARGQGFEELLNEVVRTGAPFVGREQSIMLQRAPGAPAEQRFLDFVYLPIVEADGHRSGVIAHGVDITEQVVARRDIEQLLLASETDRVHAEVARSEADAANRTKGEFLAMLSHELRTPLAAISGYAELLSMGVQGTLTPGQQQYLERIQHSQRHLLGLIDGLLIYTQADAGKLQYDIASIPMHEILTSCDMLTAPLVLARELVLDTSSCGPEILASGDREKVQQIVLNLLSNAIKFTDAGGTIRMWCESDDALVRIHVTDSGRGIAANDLARIFDPFVQLDAKGARTKGGIGLGLAISLTLARGMNGDLTAISELGTGSQFTLILPKA